MSRDAMGRVSAALVVSVTCAAAVAHASDLRLGTQYPGWKAPGARNNLGGIYGAYGLHVIRLGTDRVFNVYSHERGTTTPEYCDTRIKQAFTAGLRPVMNVIQYTKTWGPKDPWYPLADTVYTNPRYGKYYKWHRIGQSLAERYRPGSRWNLAQGHGPDWGIRVYMIFNEVDGDWYWKDKEQTRAVPVSFEAYRKMNEAFADGVHAVDEGLSVYLGPLAGSIAWRLKRDSHPVHKGYTWKGYLKSVADLFNSGKLTGWGLQLYWHNAWDVDRFRKKMAHEWFTEGKRYAGITTNPRFYSTEFNVRNLTGGPQGEAAAARLLLTHTISHLTVPDDANAPATDFALFFNVMWPNKAQFAQLAMTEKGSSFRAIKANAQGRVVMMLTELLRGTALAHIDHATGLHRLVDQSGKRTVWLFNNFGKLSTAAGTSLALRSIPAGTESVDVYRHDSYEQPTAGMRGTLKPFKRFTSLGETAVLTGLPLNESLVIVARGGAQPAGTRHSPPRRPSVSPAVLEVYDWSLIDRLNVEANGRRLEFYSEAMRTKLAVVSVGGKGTLRARDSRTGAWVSIPWKQLSLVEKKALALAVLRDGDELDHELAALYLMATGNEREAESHLRRAGDGSERVRGYFE